jgi:hypothetical protein
MVEYYWPAREDAQIIGSRRSRLDGLEKSTGAAKYTYDVNLKNQLIARALGSPHAHCKIVKIDTAAADDHRERLPFVDIERKVLHCGERSECDGQIPNAEKWFH